MKKVLVALDNSLAGKAVIASARALAALLGAELEAVHVQVDGGRTARGTAEAAAVPFRLVTGQVVEQLVEAGADEDVVALAIGARGGPTSRHPLGGTASAVASALPKPVLIVPPDAGLVVLRRVLVPLEGTPSTSLALRVTFELALRAEIDVLVLHVYDQDSIPAFTDQPQHEQPARAREFLHRHAPHGLGVVQFETRIGRSGELIPLVAEERDCDLIALGWSQELSGGRAPVVRETLARSRRPVLLVPVQPAAERDEALATQLGTRPDDR
jgi:nucleotide-binding universal stress UspA family protein